MLPNSVSSNQAIVERFGGNSPGRQKNICQPVRNRTDATDTSNFSYISLPESDLVENVKKEKTLYACYCLCALTIIAAIGEYPIPHP